MAEPTPALPRVLQFISSAGYFGAESVLVQLSSALVSLGVDVTIGVLQSADPRSVQVAEIAAERGMRVQRFPCSGMLDRGAARMLAEFARRESIDVVHGHGYKSNIYALWALRGSGAQLVSSCHNWIDASTRMRFYAAIDRLVLRRFDAVVPVSQSVRARLLAAGFDAGSVTTIENGIDTEACHQPEARADARAEFGFAPGHFVIGAVARLSEEKGHRVLFDALRAQGDAAASWRVLLVGDGPLRDWLGHLADSSGLAGRVVFAGRRGDVPRLLAAMDAFALPSFTEAQPISLLEAMAAGVPVVASRVGDVPSILGGGTRGLLVPPGDAAMLGAALQELASDADVARVRASAARIEVVEHRSALAMAHRYLDLYRGLLDRRDVPGIAARSVA